MWKAYYVFALITYLFLLVLTAKPVAAAGAMLYVDPVSSMASDDYIVANIRLNADTNNVTFVQLNLGYDAGKLEFITTEPSGSPLSHPRGGGGNGSISLAAGSYEDRVNGDVPVINLKFRILNRTGTTTLTITNPSVYNDSYSNVASSTSGATYNFGGGEAATPGSTAPVVPTVTPTPPTTFTPTNTPYRPAAVSAPSKKKEVKPEASVNPIVDTTDPPVVEADAAAVMNYLQSQGLTQDDSPSGSVFLKPNDPAPEQSSLSLLRLASIGALVLAGVAIIPLLAKRIWHIVRVAFGRTRKFEIVPPLALWSSPEADNDELQVVQDSLPYIPIAQPQPNQAVGSEEKDYEWMYDINSPLMNTL